MTMLTARRSRAAVRTALIGLFIMIGAAPAALAHCDTMSGPIIPEAKAALDKGDITPLLKWVMPDAEDEIKAAFDHARKVRATGPEAKALADQYFLETLIRVHRAGEGAPYTGLKDAPPDPIVAMADKSLAEGDAEHLITALQNHLGGEVKAKFLAAQLAAKTKDASVAAGRDYVEAYIQYVHFVEGVHNAMMAAAGHGHEAAPEAGAAREAHKAHGH